MTADPYSPFNYYCIPYTQIKTWSQSCHSFHVLRPSHCPDCRNEQRRKPHVWCKYIIHPFWQQTTLPPEVNEGCIQYIPWGVPVALFLTIHRVCEVLTRQNQSVQLRLICIYVCPTSAHWGFRYEDRQCKDNIFISKSLFQSNFFILFRSFFLISTFLHPIRPSPVPIQL